MFPWTTLSVWGGHSSPPLLRLTFAPHVLTRNVAPRRIFLDILDIGGSLANSLPTFSSRAPTQPLISAPAIFVLPVAGSRPDKKG
jgi:hypothetical protein